MTREADTRRRSEAGLSRKPSLPEEDESFYGSLGRAIKVARTQQDLSRKTLAERAGVSYAYLSDIETGRGRPSSKALLAVASALGRAPSELLQEAELYGAIHDLGSPSEEAAPSPMPAASPEPERRWFHSQATAAPEVRLRSAPSDMPADMPVRVARTELQRLARSRLAGSAASDRDELHATIDGLSDDDVRVLLHVARRLLGG